MLAEPYVVAQAPSRWHSPPVKFSQRYWILTVTLALQTAASLLQQGIGALQPLIAQRLHLDHQHVGLTVAAVSGGSAAFAATAGMAVDYFGERRILLWSGIAMGITLCLASIHPNLIWLVVWLFIFGMAYGTSQPSGGRAILLWFTSDRGFAMGIRQTGVPLGGLIGSLLLPVIALRWGYQGALLAAGIICIVVTLLGVREYRTPDEHIETAHQSFREVIRGMLAVSSSWGNVCLNLTCWTLVAAQFTALSFLAIALISLNHAPLAVAVAAMAMFQVGSAVGRLFWGTVSDRVFRGDRMAPIAVIAVMTCAVLFWVSVPGFASIPVIFAIATMLGLTAAAWNGLWAAAQAEIGGPQLAGSSIGASLTFIYLVGAVVPPVFGAIVDRSNFTVAWQLLAGLVALGIIPAFVGRRLLFSRPVRAR